MKNKENNETNERERLPRTVWTVPYQTGRTRDVFKDASLTALSPGKRKSKTGHYYWETRKNRSDTPGKRL
jgi:hypothetical protein